MRFRKNSAASAHQKPISMNHNNSLLLCRLTVAAIVVFYGVHVGANADNYTHSNYQSRLLPRFLNGHYVTWPAKSDGKTSYCDEADAPAPKPPPHIYYVPDNVVFTRMQMAGDRAFVVSPRYRPGVPFTLGYVPLTDCPSTSVVLNDSLNTEHKCNEGYHSVSPYPSLSAHFQFTRHSKQYKGKDMCDSEGIVNVVDVYLGPDGILWLLDIGVVDTLTSPDTASKPKKYNDPKVLGIDVSTGITVHKILLGTLLKPVPTQEDKLKIIARSLCSIVVEYDDHGDKGDVEGESRSRKKAADADDYGVMKKIMGDKRPRPYKWGDRRRGGNQSGRRREGDDDGVNGYGDNSDNCSDSRCNRKCGGDTSGCTGRPVVRDRRSSRYTSGATKPKPVAVYVGDACTHDRFKGLIVVWLVNDCRGIRVILPQSVSAVDDDDSCDGDLDPGRNTLHMALLDDFSGRRRRRHLYFTYGRHPDAYRIPVTAFRVDGAADLRLANCRSTGSNRCVMNVGRKPVSGGGTFGRPLIPVDSAYGVQWYFRDPAATRRSDLYVWDVRRTFHPEFFEQVVRGHRTTTAARVRHSGRCSCVAGVRGGGPPADTNRGKDTVCEKDTGRRCKDTTRRGKDTGRVKDKGRPKDKGRGKDAGRRKDTGCDADYGCSAEDGDDDPCESCNDAGDKNATGAGHGRHSGGRLSPGCMEITSLDYATNEPATGTDADGHALWALHSNIRDWVHGQTGRFGMTALLCPIVCNTAGD